MNVMPLPHLRHLPDVVVFADTTQQVSDIVKIANKFDTPFIARGGGTGLSGGMLSVQGGIIIALNRMDRILEIDIENERAVVETRCRQSSPIPSSAKSRIPLCSRPIKSEGVHYRWQYS